MNLHRTNRYPDWQTVAVKDRNIWQRIAAASRGIVTPGNVITLIGLGMVLAGLALLFEQQYLLAGGLVLLGRLCDLLDGWAADVTGTKSPFGELVDATVDKIETAAAFVVVFIAQLLPWWIVALLLAIQVLIAVIALIARHRNIVLHPSRRGKVAMALVWVLIVGVVAMRVGGINAPTIEGIAAVVVVIETLLVAREYRQQIRLNRIFFEMQ